MKTIRYSVLELIMVLSTLAFAFGGCAVEPASNSNAPAGPAPSASASASPSATAVSQAVPVTLPVLDALFSDEAFKTKLKSGVQLTDDQLVQLQKIAREEVARLRQLNAEQQAGNAEQSSQAREHAAEAIRGVIGEQKAADLFTLAREYWVAGGEGVEPGKTDKAATAPENTLLAGPNAIPKDTRVVVNIPAFRMDVFKDGSLLKSYKIGIGYPEFPLPTGLRKAQTIIFNPTWTPPDEPWVARMKNVSVGEKVAAGSKLNPLGPIKIPIGLPSLIHGGKSPAKLGTFASHGCVGLTTAQVQDFSKLLAQVAGSEISEAAIKSYFADKTKTRVVKLDQVVPVELRYETIVVEDGALHIYRDVYDQDTNTEANLRAVLEVSGIKLEDLGQEERAQLLEAVNAMSRHPVKETLTSKTANNPAATPTASPANNATKDDGKKLAATRAKKPIARNQKEVVIELAALKGKGYPAAMNLDTGSGKAATVAIAKSAANKVP
ncbi:MAG TPA: L,D-transpeptidase family protein [Pyrinomonadaceae bacterium]|jgi:lipoprotein-anchoring transpeptidase ErfK/SrfK|nr:L,D-transpeptidase family protein [Pyrinomonadaceae bacterium]